jgi:hypothetical protein
MKGKHVGFNDEVKPPSKNKDAKLLRPNADESFAQNAMNSTKRHTTKHKPFGALGDRGHPS